MDYKQNNAADWRSLLMFCFYVLSCLVPAIVAGAGAAAAVILHVCGSCG